MINRNRNAALITGLVVGLGLSACTTTDPYTGEEERSSTATGTMIGAATGAVVGAATGDDRRDRRKRALIGAGAGGLAGGMVGNYMDRQEAELRRELQGTGVSVTRDGENIILNMPSNVTFGIDSADLRPEFFDVLGSVALVILEFDQTLVEMAGHTDSTGAAAHNQGLSERRAQTVSNYLASQNVSQGRMMTIGYGENNPIATNTTLQGREQNRRVEVTLVPLTQT